MCAYGGHHILYIYHIQYTKCAYKNGARYACVCVHRPYIYYAIIFCVNAEARSCVRLWSSKHGQHRARLRSECNGGVRINCNYLESIGRAHICTQTQCVVSPKVPARAPQTAAAAAGKDRPMRSIRARLASREECFAYCVRVELA